MSWAEGQRMTFDAIFFFSCSWREAQSRTENPSAAWSFRKTTIMNLDFNLFYRNVLANVGLSQTSWKACHHNTDSESRSTRSSCYCVANVHIVACCTVFPLPPQSFLCECVGVGFVGWEQRFFISRWHFHGIYREMLNDRWWKNTLKYFATVNREQMENIYNSDIKILLIKKHSMMLSLVD